MGSNTSKFKKYIEKGDETNALHIYNKYPDLKTKLNVNLPINNDTKDTLMHVAAKNGMKLLLRSLIYDNNGNPNKANNRKQTILHKVCDGIKDQTQVDCINLLIEWKDKYTNDTININAQDDRGNTPLHYAARRNLKGCVQLLLSNGAYLFMENKDKLTPCDLAEKNGQHDMALLLESKMIFSNNEDKDDLDSEQVIIIEDNKHGLRIQDLQEEKDKLIVETADMLQCSIFTAEILLKKHSWSKEQLLHSWFDDPIKCCEKYGVSIPLSILNDNNNTQQNDNKSDNNHVEDTDNMNVNSCGSTNSLNNNNSDNSSCCNNINECAICLTSFNFNDNQVYLSCEHKICKPCWKSYLTFKIEEGSAGEMFCPYLDCFTIISHDIIESLVSKETARKYLQFDIKAFVETNPLIKWCPYPGCGMALRNPYINDNVYSIETLTNNMTNNNKDYSKSVDCGYGHYTCWDCLSEGHEPASCQNWKDWFEKIQTIKPEELHNTSIEKEISASYLWLVTNSKNCPNANCNAPIQKNEGCNHIKCSKCKHDFCWVCLEPWKKHSSSTGGYFQCNRYEVSNKVAQMEKERINEAEESHTKILELNRFVHYYSRFKNHEHSYKIEEPLLKTVKSKYEIIVSKQNNVNTVVIEDNCNSNNNKNNENNNNKCDSIQVVSSDNISSSSSEIRNATSLNNLNMEASQQQSQPQLQQQSPHLFIEEAITELLKSRRILRCSYVYGYYLNNTQKRFNFEFIQTEFEECTENLSQIIARPYLKTPKNKIIKATKSLKLKRIEFLNAISRDLVLPDTPPTLKRHSQQRWKYLLKDDSQNDDDFKNSIALSLKELNPKNPWIIDKKGRHTNLITVLEDWPELERNLESILIPSKNQGKCQKGDCDKPKAINSLSGTLFNYCSIKCLKLDCKSLKKSLSQQPSLFNKSIDSDSIDNNFDLDLQRAIEMSKIEHLNENANKIRPSESNNNVDDSNDNNDEEDDLDLAIQLSLITYNSQCLLDVNSGVILNEDNDNCFINNNFGGPSNCGSNYSEKIDNKNEYKLIPFESIYLTNDENCFGTLFKNMNEIVYENEEADGKLVHFAHKQSSLFDNCGSSDRKRSKKLRINSPNSSTIISKRNESVKKNELKKQQQVVVDTLLAANSNNDEYDHDTEDIVNNTK